MNHYRIEGSEFMDAARVSHAEFFPSVSRFGVKAQELADPAEVMKVMQFRALETTDGSTTAGN